VRKPIRLDFADHNATVALFEEAFQHPRKTYRVAPVDLTVAYQWLRDNAYMLHFNWWTGKETQAERKAAAMRKGDLLSFETLVGRGRCGWFHDCGDSQCSAEQRDSHIDGWLCDHPADKDYSVDPDTGLRPCSPAVECPVVYMAYKDEIKRKDPMLYRDNFRDWPEDDAVDGWVILRKRPRYAYVPNVVVLGCEDLPV